MTKYLWVDSIAEKWGVSKSWVYRLCRDGRVSGAFFSEGRWSIPENAEKPIDYRVHKRYINALAACKRSPLPSSMPVKLQGESDRIPDDVEKIISECADYVLDIVDVCPMSGKVLFCALSYEHIKAHVVCKNYFQYCYLAALKLYPSELYKLYSTLSFEYSMLTPDMKKGYYNEKKRLYNDRKPETLYESAALVMFLAGANGQRSLKIDPVGGNVLSPYKKNAVSSFSSKEDVKLLSRLLSRADIYRNADEARENMNFSEYSALHLCEEQYSRRDFADIEGKVERLIII